MKKYALVVGVSKYDDPEITDLSFAAHDAEEVGRCLVEVCGFDDVRTLATGGGHEPDHVNVVDALHSLAPLLSREDLFLFYFAGHGIETKTGAHLLASNSRIRMPELASISNEVLSDCLSRIECADRVLILDACRNNPRKGMGDEDNLLTSSFSRDIMAVAQTPVEGIVPVTCVLFSCQLHERAYEWPDMGHGAFTHYLLEGLRGAAADDSGHITVQALGRYVETQVPRWAKKARTPKPQTPWGEQKGSWREIFLTARAPSVSQPQPKPTPSLKPVKNAPAATMASEPDTETEKLRQSILADMEECERLMRRGRGWKTYLEQKASERITDWRKGVRRNWPEALWLMAGCHEEGIEIKHDAIRAAELCRKAAEQGYAPAQSTLGVCYLRGAGVDENKVEGIKWLRKAAEQEYAPAQCTMGFCYSVGVGVDENKVEAVRWNRKAAEQGYAIAQFDLGKCYSSGDGISQDKVEAIKWYRKAAEQGNADAQYKLGICYYNGEGVNKDKDEAIKWYRKAAEQGLADAQNRLGFCYSVGVGVDKDEAEAVKWYHKAAEQDYAAAQFNLGVCYGSGEGVERDPHEAVKWYRKAAEQGYAGAQYNLGVCYAHGNGVAKDPHEAAKWYGKSAKQRNTSAQEASEKRQKSWIGFGW